MTESAGILNHIILGSLGVIVGLIATFFGYGIFRLILPVLGFFYGYILGSSLVDSTFWGFVIGVLFALVLGVLAYAYWSLLVTIGGAIIGFSLGFAFGEWLNFWDWVSVLIGVGLAVIFGALWFMFKDLMVMWLTAFAGAGIVAAGLAYFWPLVFGWLTNEGNWIAAILVIALGIVGFLAQMVIFSSQNFYSEPPPGGPPYVYIPSSSAATSINK